MLLVDDYRERCKAFGFAWDSRDCERVNKNLCLICQKPQIYSGFENPKTGRGFAVCQHCWGCGGALGGQGRNSLSLDLPQRHGKFCVALKISSSVIRKPQCGHPQSRSSVFCDIAASDKRLKLRIQSAVAVRRFRVRQRDLVGFGHAQRLSDIATGLRVVAEYVPELPQH